MNHALSLSSPYQSIFWPKNNSFIKQTLLILSGVVLLALASRISIPFVPVPLTFQSATVVLIGMAYGARLGTSVIAAYLIAGFCGLPVFTDPFSGFAALKGPTLGYLLGFLPAAYLSGYLAQKGFAKNRVKSFIAACLGASIIFIFGVSVLAQMIGWEKAIALGFMPFIISEPVKLLAVSLFIPRLWKPKS